MKKIILASIMASVFGIAQAQQTGVEVYGKMRVYQETYKAGTADSLTQQTNDTSRIGFRGVENLGGGLKATFTVETSIGADSPVATSLGDRTSLVGLSNQYGSLSLGRDKHSLAKATDNFDTMGGNIYGSSVATIHSVQGSRVSNGSHISMSPLKNVTINYQYAASEVAGSPAVQAGSVDVNFGPGSATIARYDNGTNSESTLVGAKFNFEKTGTTLFTMYSEDKVVGVESRGKSVGVAQKITSNITALASYGEKETVKAYNLGATYNLSKRTMIHARYVNENAVLATADVRRFGLGIEHNF